MIDIQSCGYLGHFCLYERIGSGGFADVYRAIDLFLQREVAIKVFRTRVAQRDYETINRYALEARTLARLKHPHIVEVLEFNIDNYTPYLVMEHARNGSLRHIHPLGERIEWEIILNYVAQITSALTFIHLNGVIHQDIKPENLLMNENCEILVSDFGTVALVQHTDPYAPFQFVGTIQYAAPERFLEAAPTPASDIYSLACVVFEWFTGEPLFTGSRSEIIYQHRFVKPSVRRMSALGISRPIQRVLFKALSKNPAERYQNASDFFSALYHGVYKKERRRFKRVMVSGIFITGLLALLLALVFHSVLILFVALPILFILLLSLVASSKKQSAYKATSLVHRHKK